MPVRSAEAEWKGNLARGTGTLRTESGVVDAAYSFGSRFESGSGTNPEELIAAAHAGCFAMALSHMLAQEGQQPERVHARARVHLEKVDEGMEITRIALECTGRVPGIDAATFRDFAERARKGCIVSKALAAVETELQATLEE